MRYVNKGDTLSAVLMGIESVLMYSLLAPLVLIFLPGLVAGALPYMPQFVQTAVAAIVAALKVVTELPVISSILTFLGNTLFASLIDANISLAMIGLVRLASIPVLALGAGVTIAAEKINAWYKSLHTEPKVDPVLPSEAPAVPADSNSSTAI